MRKGYVFLLILFVAGGLAFRPITLPGNSGSIKINKFKLAHLPHIQTGDLVVRCGKGFISDIFKNTSGREKKYSHAGIAVVESSRIFVVHSIGNKITALSGIRKESISDFCNSNENSSFAVYRYDLDKESLKLIPGYLTEKEAAHIPFDEQFNLDTDNAMYCSELVAKTIQYASHNQQYFQHSKLNNQSYIGIDDLYLNIHSHLVFSSNY